MTKEVIAYRPEEQEEKDPHFREHEHGSYLIDQIQIQRVERVSKNKRIPPKQVPYLAQGFVYYRDALLGFKAFNATYDMSLGVGNTWSVYAPLHPGKMDQLVGQPSITEENYERLQDVYPQAFPLEQTDYASYQEAFVRSGDTLQREAFASLVRSAIEDRLNSGEPKK